jgi:hypothetical protein
MQPDSPLSEVVEDARQPYFRLLVHGTFGGKILNLKISSESQTLEAGSSILEGLDRLFKLFWIFGIEYTVGCENFYRFLHTAVYKLSYGKVPKFVTELVCVLRRQVEGER